MTPKSRSHVCDSVIYQTLQQEEGEVELNSTFTLNQPFPTSLSRGRLAQMKSVTNKRKRAHCEHSEGRYTGGSEGGGGEKALIKVSMVSGTNGSNQFLYRISRSLSARDAYRIQDSLRD
ncbi:hypothetical protein J6590_012289 [Homalodisca vitripennis]|nr:hypothetical protein J6590_012289 [Homalodisca vitripennis]